MHKRVVRQGETEKIDDSSIGNSMSSQVQKSRQSQESIMQSSPPNIGSSPVSEDRGFINYSPIPRRFQTVQGEAEMQTAFEKQQQAAMVSIKHYAAVSNRRAGNCRI